MHQLTRRGVKFAAAILLGTATTWSAAAPIFWTDWTGSTSANGFTAGGTITTDTATVGVTYNNPLGVAFINIGASNETDYWTPRVDPSVSPYTSSAVDNIPTGTDMIALQFAGSQSLAFSQSIANPVFSFVSLNGNGYAFLDQDFDILSQSGVDGNACGYWGCGTVTKVVVDLGNGHTEYQLNSTGGEPHGTIQFKGAFSSLTWASRSNENWNGFTVGIQGTAAEVFPMAPVPEPETYALMLAGLALLGAVVKRRR